MTGTFRTSRGRQRFHFVAISSGVLLHPLRDVEETVELVRDFFVQTAQVWLPSARVIVTFPHPSEMASQDVRDLYRGLCGVATVAHGDHPHLAACDKIEELSKDGSRCSICWWVTEEQLATIGSFNGRGFGRVTDRLAVVATDYEPVDLTMDGVLGKIARHGAALRDAAE